MPNAFILLGPNLIKSHQNNYVNFLNEEDIQQDQKVGGGFY